MATNNLNQIESIFTEQGGVFCIPIENFKQKLDKIKAFIFDWDGVFNDGIKNDQGSSSFSEVDAMGTNLLRFSHFLNKKELPFTTVMSGERNVMSFQYANREHFHHVYFKVKNKKPAFDHFIAAHNLSPDEVLFVFDDVLDLSVAEACGLRILINRKANPLFKNYVIKNELADYVTANPSGSFAVRETCEMLMGVTGNFEAVVQERSGFSDAYANYYNTRQQTATEFFTWQNEAVEKTGVPD